MKRLQKDLTHFACKVFRKFFIAAINLELITCVAPSERLARSFPGTEHLAKADDENFDTNHSDIEKDEEQPIEDYCDLVPRILKAKTLYKDRR